jgi:hypothetical protein
MVLSAEPIHPPCQSLYLNEKENSYPSGTGLRLPQARPTQIVDGLSIRMPGGSFSRL